MKGSILMMMGLCLLYLNVSYSSPAPSDEYEYYETYYDYYGDDLDYYGEESSKCNVVCQRPKSDRCKKRRKAAGCPVLPTPTANNNKCPPVVSTGPTNPPKCPIQCKQKDSKKCKERNKKAGCAIQPKPTLPSNPSTVDATTGGSVACNNPCKCSGKTLPGPKGLPVGECYTRNPKNNRFFCYVDSNTPCTDKEASKRHSNTFASYLACDFQRECGHALPDYDYDYEYEEGGGDDYEYDDYEFDDYAEA